MSVKTTMTETSAAVATPGATAAPENAPLKKGASIKKDAPQSQNAANGGKAKAAAPKKAATTVKKPATPALTQEASSPRPQSKGANILEMIGRAKGATLPEIMKKTAWQAHSVRGFLSSAAKKYGLKIKSTKTEAGRVYQIKK